MRYDEGLLGLVFRDPHRGSIESGFVRVHNLFRIIRRIGLKSTLHFIPKLQKHLATQSRSDAMLYISTILNLPTIHSARTI